MTSVEGYKLSKSIIDFDTDNVGFQKAEKEIDETEVEILWIQKKKKKTIMLLLLLNGYLKAYALSS